MKKALKLITTYFLILFFGLLLGTILYSFYLNVMKFVAGNEIVLFSFSELAKAGIYVSYCFIFLICPVISYYRVRHPAGFPQIIAYVIICLFTWLVFFPGVYFLDKVYEKHNEGTETSIHFSKGYFRPGDEKIYFFTKDFESKNDYKPNAVVIDTTEDGIVTFENVYDDNTFELSYLSNPYKEIQVKKSFNMRGNSIPVNFKMLIYVAKRAFSESFLSYLGFLSLAVSICILFAFSTFFEWRLINTTLIFFFTSLILSINSFYYSYSFISIKTKLTNNRFFDFMGNYISEPLIFVANNLFTIIFVIVIVVRVIVKNHKNKDR